MEGSLMTTGRPWVLGQIFSLPTCRVVEAIYVQSLPHPQARPKSGPCTFLSVFTSLSCVRILSGVLPLPFQEPF